MSKFKKKLKKAALAGIALYSASKMLGAQKTAAPIGAPASAKTPSSSKIKKRVVDLGDETKNIVGKNRKITVDVNASGKEIEEAASKVKATEKKINKAVVKRKEEGMLSPTMPKSKSQGDALSNNFGFGLGAKKGKMIRARGGGLAKGGMRPTKLY